MKRINQKKNTEEMTYLIFCLFWSRRMAISKISGSRIQKQKRKEKKRKECTGAWMLPFLFHFQERAMYVFYFSLMFIGLIFYCLHIRKIFPRTHYEKPNVWLVQIHWNICDLKRTPHFSHLINMYKIFSIVQNILTILWYKIFARI